MERSCRVLEQSAKTAGASDENTMKGGQQRVIKGGTSVLERRPQKGARERRESSG
jgi:hypothetical protein